MKNYNTILTDKQQKILALSSGKIDEYEYITGKEILSSNQIQIIKQAKFIYSPSGKALEKQTKTIDNVAKKQAKAIEDRLEKQILNTDQKSISDLFPRNSLAAEARNELNKIKEIEQETNKDDLVYKIQADNAKVMNVEMLLYNLIVYSEIYSKASRSLWQ